MDYTREEALTIIGIDEAIQKGRLNTEYATARDVAIAAGSHHWVTGYLLDHLLDVRAGTSGRGLWRRSVEDLTAAIAKALPQAEAVLEESDAALRALGYDIPERETSKRQDSIGDVVIGDVVFAGSGTF